LCAFTFPPWQGSLCGLQIYKPTVTARHLQFARPGVGKSDGRASMFFSGHLIAILIAIFRGLLEMSRLMETLERWLLMCVGKKKHLGGRPMATHQSTPLLCFTICLFCGLEKNEGPIFLDEAHSSTRPRALHRRGQRPGQKTVREARKFRCVANCLVAWSLARQSWSFHISRVSCCRLEVANAGGRGRQSSVGKG
jgi:hypothetical protein